MPSAFVLIWSAGAVGAVLLITPVVSYTVKRFINIVLNWSFSIKNRAGQPIQGPTLDSVNGQTLEKFLNGREKSQEWQTFGQVYRLWAGANPEIVISSPDDIRAFHTDSNFHNKARSSNAGWMFHQILGECMGLVNGAEWRAIRDGLVSSFTHPSIRTKKELINNEARDFIHGWAASQPPTFTAQAAASVARFPFFCTGTHIYGWLAADEKEAMWQLGQRSLQLMGHVLSGGLFRYSLARLWYPQAMRDLDGFMDDWFAFNERIYHSRKDTTPALPIVTMWDQMVHGDITREHLLHTLSEILFANLDVSTGTLSWLVIYLASDQAVQQGIVQEMRDSKDSIEEYCAKKDTLLAYSMLETMRLRPFTVFSIPESSPSEKVLGGYMVRPNTSVIVNTLAVNYNPAFWGAKAETFSPLRFKNIKATDLRYNLFTFGFGTRKCLGSHLAELMLKTFMVHLLNIYSLEMPASDAVRGSKATSQDTWVPISDESAVFTKRKAAIF